MSLQDLTVKELKILAKLKGVPAYYNLNKDSLIDEVSNRKSGHRSQRGGQIDLQKAAREAVAEQQALQQVKVQEPVSRILPPLIAQPEVVPKTEESSKKPRRSKAKVIAQQIGDCPAIGDQLKITLHTPTKADESAFTRCQALHKNDPENIPECVQTFECTMPGMPRFLRPYSKKFFPGDRRAVYPQCCKRSFKAVVRGVINSRRMTNTYTYLEMKKMIESSQLPNDQKQELLAGAKQSDKEYSAFENEHFKADSSRMDIDLMTMFANDAKVLLHAEMLQLLEKGKEDSSETDELLGGSSGTDFAKWAVTGTWDSIKKATNASLKVLMTLSKSLWRIAKLGLSVVEFVVNHPAIAMWLLKAALAIKRQLCEYIGIKLGLTKVDRKELDLWDYVTTVTKEWYGQNIKAFLLTSVHQFLNSPMFDYAWEGITWGLAYATKSIPFISMAITPLMSMSKKVVHSTALATITTFIIYHIKEEGMKLLTEECIKPKITETVWTGKLW